MMANNSAGSAKLISMSIWVNSGWRSARRSSSRKQRHDLEIALEARDHQQLFELLRRLGQGEHLALVYPGWDQVIAGAFGRGFGQHRSFDVDESLLAEILAGFSRLTWLRSLKFRCIPRLRMSM